MRRRASASGSSSAAEDRHPGQRQEKPPDHLTSWVSSAHFTRATPTIDFDFLVGSWHGRHRRLRKALAGCDEWDEFASSTTCWSVFGGAANVDEVTVPDLGFAGLTVRLLDPVARTWSLWWVNSKNGQMDPPPVTGSFANGIGRFYCDQVSEGRPIRCRYTWSEITPASARWDWQVRQMCQFYLHN